MRKPEVARFEVEAAQLAVRLAGDREKPALLLIHGLLARLGVGSFHLYLHDYGAPVGLHLATRAPRGIRSLIVQNAHAHESGMGPQWSATRAYWDDPTPEREVEATAHLTFEGTRDQYAGGVPRDIAERVDPRMWEEDWRIMSLPGRLETQRVLVLDYRSHVARFGRSPTISIAGNPRR